MIDRIERTAAMILERSPGPVVRYRLLGDVLEKAPDSPEMRQARRHVEHSLCVRELACGQQAGGGWGAFHSRSARPHQRIPSTEVGVERAVSLGLDPGHPILRKASDYVRSIMQGATAFPDRHERNDRWPTGMRLFLASTLSLIHPGHPALDQDRALWHEIARRSFRSGEYREQDEIDAHADLTGASVRNSYLVLDSRYQLNILGSVPGVLSMELEEALLEWLWQRPDGVGYLGIPLSQPPPTKPGQFDRWMASLETLSRSFPMWVRHAQPATEWLWEQQSERATWDLGPRPQASSFLPLSDNWRSRKNRVFDWTARVLILLRAYHESVQVP
jgi:hypothetical protein